MKMHVKLVFMLLFSSLLLFGCGSDDDVTETPQQNDDTESIEDDSNADLIDGDTILTEIYSYQDEDDISMENISINYDGSVVFFNRVDDSGEDEVYTPYFVYNGEVIDVSSIDTFSDCRFYSISETDTAYFTGICDDENEDRVAVVYDVVNNTVTHSTDRDKNLTVMTDGRVLFVEQYGDKDGTIYELTENGEEPFIVIDDMPSVLGFNADQQGEVFFIYGANDDYWNSYIYDTTNDTGPVLFKEVLDDDEATTVEGRISPDGEYIMYRYRGVVGGKHYNYVDSYIYNRETEEEIHLGHGFDMNFVRPTGYVIDEVRKYGQVIFNIDTSKWLGPDEVEYDFLDSIYKNEYVMEEDRNAIASSMYVAISGDGETILTLDRFHGMGDQEEHYKLQTIQTENYMRSLEDQNVEIDFEPSPFNEIGA